jgi:hypothetical protein
VLEASIWWDERKRGNSGKWSDIRGCHSDYGYSPLASDDSGDTKCDR